MARNQPGQKGGNQGAIFMIHIVNVSKQEMAHPASRLVNHNRIRRPAILSPPEWKERDIVPQTAGSPYVTQVC